MMLEQELAAEALTVSIASIASIIGPNVAGGKTQDALRMMQERVDNLDSLHRFAWESQASKEAQLRQSAEGAVEVYKAMKKSGAFEMFDKKAEEIYNSQQN